MHLTGAKCIEHSKAQTMDSSVIIKLSPDYFGTQSTDDCNIFCYVHFKITHILSIHIYALSACTYL